jgi:TolA-binding protein
VAIALIGCAKSGDLEKVQQDNRVQDARLKALEDGMADAVRKQIEPLLRKVEDLQRSLDARYTVLTERLDQFVSEQERISSDGEANRALIKKDERRFEEHAKAQALAWQEQANDVDKLRLRVQDVDRLLKSPIADLPAVTEADKVYREAHYLMISGQLDLAADKFAQFVQSFPTDRRRPEALLRQGQAYFMMRKYDFSLSPLYELVDKQAGAKAAVEGRWYIARALEETGDLKLARDFYAQLITGKTVYAADASRRVALIQKLYPSTGQDSARPARDAKQEPPRERAPGERPPAPPNDRAPSDTETRPDRPRAGERG